MYPKGGENGKDNRSMICFANDEKVLREGDEVWRTVRNDTCFWENAELMWTVANYFHRFLVLIALFAPRRVECAEDAGSTLLRNLIYMTKDAIEKFLFQWRPPKLSTDGNGRISFQLDDSLNVDASPCIFCNRAARKESLVGTWRIVLASRNFMLSTLNDVDTTISKLERNQPVTSQKTFFEWIAPPPDLRCAQLTILDSADKSKFELVYRRANSGLSKSIVGDWERDGFANDGSFLWSIVPPNIMLKVCVAFMGQVLPSPQQLLPRSTPNRNVFPNVGIADWNNVDSTLNIGDFGQRLGGQQVAVMSTSTVLPQVVPPRYQVVTSTDSAAPLPPTSAPEYALSTSTLTSSTPIGPLTTPTVMSTKATPVSGTENILTSQPPSKPEISVLSTTRRSVDLPTSKLGEATTSKESFLLSSTTPADSTTQPTTAESGTWSNKSPSTVKPVIPPENNENFITRTPEPPAVTPFEAGRVDQNVPETVEKVGILSSSVELSSSTASAPTEKLSELSEAQILAILRDCIPRQLLEMISDQPARDHKAERSTPEDNDYETSANPLWKSLLESSQIDGLDEYNENPETVPPENYVSTDDNKQRGRRNPSNGDNSEATQSADEPKDQPLWEALEMQINSETGDAGRTTTRNHVSTAPVPNSRRRRFRRHDKRPYRQIPPELAYQRSLQPLHYVSHQPREYATDRGRLPMAQQQQDLHATQFVVLNQIDSAPLGCDNYVILARFAAGTEPGDAEELAQIAQIREYLERENVESAFNKLERIRCDRLY